jgi:hypothetical protein
MFLILGLSPGISSGRLVLNFWPRMMPNPAAAFTRVSASVTLPSTTGAAGECGFVRFSNGAEEANPPSCGSANRM